MTEPFILSVLYKGETLQLPAQLLLQGYIHRFKITVRDTELLFEPDEEGLYRAVSMEAMGAGPMPAVDRDLLQLIQEQLAALSA